MEKVAGSRVSVFYLDFGNREVTEPTKCALLPPGLDKAPFYAKELVFAFAKYYQEVGGSFYLLLIRVNIVYFCYPKILSNV